MWTEYSEQKRYLEETRRKIEKAEGELEAMAFMKEQGKQIDEVQMECTLNLYRNLINLQKTYERELLKLPAKLFAKIEN
eukprot:CAMPEP_0202972026 /NCGR_PEP_ID=MMETSP1396-20130829/32761_1 /ASSEMBLY_ACC=CAM_ASM_000872 /TAXON_ID= /ORGANISM="Pseudokeronopsis sp., Strain Brazil" /LENGTH=78 /DNA_ID=CAMNT_0049702015 /DNA_START=248 /DNA_END=484 /DNA_ORIENTATION=+